MNSAGSRARSQLLFLVVQLYTRFAEALKLSQLKRQTPLCPPAPPRVDASFDGGRGDERHDEGERDTIRLKKKKKEKQMEEEREERQRRRELP